MERIPKFPPKLGWIRTDGSRISYPIYESPSYPCLCLFNPNHRSTTDSFKARRLDDLLLYRRITFTFSKIYLYLFFDAFSLYLPCPVDSPRVDINLWYGNLNIVIRLYTLKRSCSRFCYPLSFFLTTVLSIREISCPVDSVYSFPSFISIPLYVFSTSTLFYLLKYIRRYINRELIMNRWISLIWLSSCLTYKQTNYFNF